MTKYGLVVARNATFEEVSCKVNGYFVSRNTIYRYVDGFNKYRISISDNKVNGRHVSAVIKTSIF